MGRLLRRLVAPNAPPAIVALTPPPDPLPRDRAYAPVDVGLVAESVSWKEPPRPVPYSEFWATGRATRNAWPHRWIFNGWNADEILTVQNPNGFAIANVPSAMVIPGSPQPGQRPFPESVAIIAPPRGTFGARATVAPPVAGGPQYAKLM